MALLGHTIVEAGLARLVGFLPQVSRSANLRLKAGVAPKFDAIALVKANEIYAGQVTLNAENFADLSWLEHFADSARQLLMCHALKLLEGWNQQKQPRRNFLFEALILRRLTYAAQHFAANLDTSLLEPLSLALQNQIKRVLALHVHEATEQLAKALLLLDVVQVVEDSQGLQKEAAKLLDTCLPNLVASDGGPVHHGFKDYVSWINQLLDAVDTPIQSNTRNALDRARPFLSMLIDQDLTYCFDRQQKPHPLILNTAAMQLAPSSGVARLQAGKSLGVILPFESDCPSALHLSSRGQWLLSCGVFLHDQDAASPRHVLTLHNADEGHLLQQTMGKSERMVFASPKGDDIRLEDVLPQDGLIRWMRLCMNHSTKLSVSRNGSIATLAVDGRNLWQLTLRGAKLLPQQQNGEVWVETMPGQVRINWALRRIVRSSARGPKPDIPELPF
jgi:hypothetical protein